MLENRSPEPPQLSAIWQATAEAGFSMPSDHDTGRLLRTLAAGCPGGRLLELGTGTGLSAAWLLDGMTPDARLDSVDNEAAVSEIARDHLAVDQRLHIYVEDAATFLQAASADSYDFVFADAWPGKYSYLDEAINCLKAGGIYVVDDMLPQPNWPDGHAEKAAQLCDELESRKDLRLVKMNWSTGIILATKIIP